VIGKLSSLVCLIAVVALFNPLQASAEGGCPAGMYPIGGGSGGWSGCAPIPAGGGQADALARPQWSSRWGAIATGNGAFGSAVDERSKRQANKAAMKQCVARGGQDCRVQIWFSNQCAALAWSDKGSFTHGAINLEDAKAGVLRVCSERGGECRVFWAECSYAKPIK